jgi:hypothetical protein
MGLDGLRPSASTQGLRQVLASQVRKNLGERGPIGRVSGIVLYELTKDINCLGIVARRGNTGGKQVLRAIQLWRQTNRFLKLRFRLFYLVLSL